MADENKELEQFLQDLLDEEQKRHEEFLKRTLGVNADD